MIRRSGTSLIALASLVLLLTSCSYLQPPTGEISMDEAVGIVTEQVLPGAVPKGATYVCSRLDESIPAGSVIEEATPETETTGSARLSPRSLPVSEESFFFFLDLAPRALYAHPVKYIVVAKSGTSHVVEAEWWPKINGVPPAELLGDYPNPSRVIAGNVDLTPPVGNVMTFHLAHASLLGREGFIVVQGAMPNEPLYDEIVSTYQNAMNFFSGYRNAVSSVVGLVENHALEIRDEIDRMAGEGRSPITLFIIGHGVANAVWLGGRAFTSPGLRAKMAEHPDTLFNLVLGSCYSGSFINVLKALPNVRAIETACGTSELAYGDHDRLLDVDDSNPEDSGTEWTSSILEAAAAIVADSVNWTKVHSFATANDLPETCALLCAAATGATGENEWLGLTQNLDLTNRTGLTTPQGYCSWELVVPPIPPTPPIIWWRRA